MVLEDYHVPADYYNITSFMSVSHEHGHIGGQLPIIQHYVKSVRISANPETDPAIN
jgi:hypothetical protein